MDFRPVTSAAPFTLLGAPGPPRPDRTGPSALLRSGETARSGGVDGAISHEARHRNLSGSDPAWHLPGRGPGIRAAEESPRGDGVVRRWGALVCT